MYKIVLSLACFLLCAQIVTAQSAQSLLSPDGKLQFTFDLTGEGAPNYSIFYQQTPIVLSSALGLSGWEKGFALSDISKVKGDTVW
ncbi:MAG TPA: glycoside hydrolase family 97 N-terminal domain-containing protein, partial [Flavitalea sp.]|nr:glycoside hydrolase family 97 N-terminal domain-containing protein [Flavitalea sp.]